MGTYGDSDDPYASTNDDGESFVKVVEGDSEDFVELPAESDNTISLSTLQGQFPNAIGLRYKGSSGGWRAVRITDGVLTPPTDGWGEKTYNVTLQPESGKRKTIEPIKDEPESKSSKSSKSEKSEKPSKAEKQLLQDLIVFGLPSKCTDSDLKEYFTSACGEMALHQVKYSKAKKPRGFGFIRFKTAEGSRKALTGDHSVMGRTVEIRLSKKRQEPMKIFVGRIPEGTTQEELKEYFEEFGEVSDSFLPTPFRGFGFVTFANSGDGRAVLRRDHKIGDSRLNVQFAEPREEKIARRRREERDAHEESRRGRSRGDSDYFPSSDYKDSRDRSRHREAPRGMNERDSAEIKEMLFSLLNSGY